MKLSDLDFRIVLGKDVIDDFVCGKDNCPCSTPLLYGMEARYYLNELYDKDCEIELWSGFYDKNGKKIYVGDMVKYRKYTKPLEVVYAESTFYIIHPSIEKEFQVDCGTRLQGIYDNRDNGYKDNKLECVEVLGNIHENRETQ